MKRKLICYLLTICSVFCVILMTPTMGKYFGVKEGVLGSTTFVDYISIATEFKITDPVNTTESGSLWGLNSTTLNPNNKYTMDKLNKVDFSAYNSTNQDMLISFKLVFFANYTTEASASLTVVNTKSTDEKNNMVGSFKLYFGFLSPGNAPTSDYFVISRDTSIKPTNGHGLYCQHSIYINPIDYFKAYGEGNTITNEEKQIIENYFVIKGNVA